jgi:hypothetical protein
VLAAIVASLQSSWFSYNSKIILMFSIEGDENPILVPF